MVKNPNVSHINIITYNIFCRPSYVCYDEQIKRAKRVPLVLKRTMGDKKFEGLDIICLVETFDHDVNDILTEEFHKLGFKHSTNVLDSYSLLKLKFINGGIRMFSRHEILRSEFRMFPFSKIMNIESYVGKGALGVKICKNGINWHVIGTHLAAWKHGRADRKVQLGLIDEFISEMKYADIVKENEPIVITGDFNIDAFTGGDDLKRIYKKLDTYHLPKKCISSLEGGIGSYTTLENTLIGRDGDERETVNELLDYSLIVKNSKYKLHKYTMKVLKLYKFNKDMRGILYKDTGKRSRNLSDHFPNLTKIAVKFKK